MKKLISYALALILGFTLCSAGCKHDSMGPDPDYVGTWKVIIGQTYTATFTPDNKFIVEIVDGAITYGCIMKNLTWTSRANTTGPLFATHQTGYAIKGEVTALTNGFSISKADGSAGSAAVGDIGICWWYIFTDKGKIAGGNPFSPEHEAMNSPILIKQP